ncbi:MAG: hypothetical protein IJ682_03440 [Lachnospiraceae bacterium]|nr:hypothetical protein [Lachnospiraceae bacterium]
MLKKTKNGKSVVKFEIRRFMWSNWKLSTENLFLNFGEANGIEGVIDLDKAKMGKNAISKIARKPENKGK